MFAVNFLHDHALNSLIVSGFELNGGCIIVLVSFVSHVASPLEPWNLVTAWLAEFVCFLAQHQSLRKIPVKKYYVA